MQMSPSNIIESARSLSQILSISFFKKVIYKDDTSMIRARLKKHYHNVSSSQSQKYGYIIADLYDVLKTNYCNEYIYKNTIVNELLLKKYGLEQTVLLNEFSINRSIADLILVNGEPVLYEIKTALDNTDRLPSQIEDYRKAISKICLVVSSKSVSEVLEKYSSTEIGVYEFTEEHELLVHREANENSIYLEHATLFRLLRKDEYLKIVQEYFGFVPDVPNTKIFSECLKLVSLINVTELQRMVFSQLKKRKLKCPDRLQSEETPYELKHMCYVLDLSEAEYDKLYKFLGNNV